MFVAGAIRTDAPGPEDSRGTHNSTRGCVHSWRVDRIAPELIHSKQPLVERYGGFPRDVTQLLDDRQNQRHTFLAPQLFHLAFGIAGNQGAVGARRRPCGAKDADVVVDLMPKRISVDKAVDAHSAEEMADSLPDAAFRNFLAKSKGRRKRPPICPTEHAAQDVHHDGQRIALMSSALAIRAERQEHSALQDVVRIG